MIALALKFLKTKAGMGLALSAAIFVAIGATSVVRYRAGLRDGEAIGIAKERAARDSVDKIADAAAARARAATDSVITSLRVALAQRDRDLQAAKQAAALASGRYAAAQEAYEALKAAKVASGDTTTTPLERACETAAATCALTVKAKEAEVVAVELKLATAEQLVARQDSTIREEPARTSRAVVSGIQQDRRTRKERSRTTWALIGAGTLEMVRWLVRR